MKKIEEYVRSIPDFPEKGIIFRDITSVSIIYWIIKIFILKKEPDVRHKIRSMQ